MSSLPLKRSRKVTNRANKMLAQLCAEVPGTSQMVPQRSDPTSQRASQLQEIEDSPQLANPINTSEISFNLSGGGMRGDVVKEELEDSNTVDQDGGGYINLDSSLEFDEEDAYASNRSSDSDSEDVVGECTTAHSCRNHGNITDCLRDWAVMHNQPRSSINEILAIFSKWTNLSLPKDSRMLLRTSTTIGQEIRTVEGGQFWYKGIENKLNSYFQSTVPSTNQLTIMLSIDGLPLHRGSSTQLWPILMKVEELPLSPIIMIAMYCGPEKPTGLEAFLRPLVDELIVIQQRGLRLGDKVLQLKLRAIIADSPARAFIKATTNYKSYHGCMRCTCVGEYYSRRMIFDTVGAPLRTDAGFRARECPGHHQLWRSPLEDLPGFNMVESVPTSDRLHTCDLGVTRRHLLLFVENKYPNFPNLSSAAKGWISKFLTNVQLPSEINRKLRGLELLRFWKGSEFRSYLHYASVVLMEEFLSEKAYCHFLLYFCALTIFSSAFHQRHWERAAEFLNTFVEQYGEIYGRENLTINVHNLQHIAQDVLQYGPLDGFSTYCFENHLQVIKRSVRSGFRCGIEAATRSEERSALRVASDGTNRRYPHLTKNGKGIFLATDFALRPLPGDEWFLTKGNGIVKFSSVIQRNGKFTIVGKQYEYMVDLFSFLLNKDDPESDFSSSDILIYKVPAEIATQNVEVDLADIRCKLVAVHSATKPVAMVFFPLLHTLQSE